MQSPEKLNIYVLCNQEQHNIASCCRANPKIFWKYVSNKTRISEDIAELIHVNEQGQSVLATTDNNKPEILCTSFASVF